jgi:hypothetical protein
LARLARATAAAAVLLLGAGRLFAQGTLGKVEGTVRDQAGAPIAGAQVLIVGSALNSTTNEQGYYFINNVPAGVMTVRAQFIGYAPAERREVRVFAGQTMTVNLALEQRAIEVGGITVTVEANPLVPRDQVASKPIVQGALIDALPADNVNQVLRLQPGVVESNRGLVIRGGRPREAATYIDGVLVRNMGAQFMGIQTSGQNPPEVQIGTNAVEEASVTTGAIGAEFGDAQSGIISLVTRSGGSTYSGAISYATDEVSGQTYGTGLHRVEASFGGPISRNLTFFLSTTLQGRQNDLRGKGAEDVPIFVMNGLDTSDPLAPNGYIMAPKNPGDPLTDSARVDIPAFTRYSNGSRRPDDQEGNLTMSGKLAYSYGAGSRVSLGYHRSRRQDWFYRGLNLYNPQSQRGSQQTSNALVLNLSQNLARSADQLLTLDVNLSWQRDQFLSGLLDPAWVNDNRDPFLGFNFGAFQFITNFDNFPVDDELVRNIRLNNCDPNTGGRCVPFLDRTDYSSIAPFRSNPYGVTAGTSYFTSGGFGLGGPTLQKETRLTGRVVLDWQANRYNRVRVGGDFTRADMFAYSSGLINRIDMDAFHETPLRYALFFTDRVDLGDVVIEGGLRYDRLNSGVSYPRVPSRVFSDPLRSGDLSAAQTAADTVVAQRCAAFMAAGDNAGWSTCNFVDAEAKSVLSPNVRVSFPITDRTGFRLSYAHQAQSPDFGLLASGASRDIQYTNTNRTFGRDLGYSRSILFEFGIRHAFSDDMVLDVSAYNKDKTSDITVQVRPIFDPVLGTTANINMVLNADFGNARGIDVQLDRRIGQLFQGRLAYSYQSARSTGSDPFEYIGTTARQVSSVTGDRVPPPTALLTTRDNRTHTVSGTATMNFPHGWHAGTTIGTLLQDFGFAATYRFASGLAYTRLQNNGDGQLGPGNGLGLVGATREPLNASSMPWLKQFDLRVTRGFRMGGGRTVTTFAEFRNLFNFTNLDAIWAETGDVRNAVHRQKAISPILVTLAQEAGSLSRIRDVTRNGTTVRVTGYDLSDCSLYPYNSNGTAGAPNCIFLRGAERRFGDGDAFFDEDEQAAAFNAWYDLFNGPQTLRGSGFNLRFGIELNF